MDEEANRTFPWLPASVVAGVALALIYWLGGKGGANQAFNFGYAFGGAAVVWVVLLLIGMRRSGAAGIFGSLAVLWGLAYVGLLASSLQTGLHPGTEGRISGELGRVIEEVTSGTFEPIDEVELETVSGGERGQLELLMSRLLNEIVAMQNEYLAELQVIGWETILAPERLNADRHLVESKRMLAQARDAATRMCDAQVPRLEAASRRIASELALSEKTRAAALEGFVKGMERSEETRLEVCRLEMEILKEFEGLIVVFEADPEWVMEDGMYLFTDDRHVAQFNTHFERIGELTEQQEMLRKTTMTEAQSKLRNLGF